MKAPYKDGSHFRMKQNSFIFEQRMRFLFLALYVTTMEIWTHKIQSQTTQEPSSAYHFKNWLNVKEKNPKGQSWPILPVIHFTVAEYSPPLDKFAALPSLWTFLFSKGQDFKSSS